MSRVAPLPKSSSTAFFRQGIHDDDDDTRGSGKPAGGKKSPSGSGSKSGARTKSGAGVDVTASTTAIRPGLPSEGPSLKAVIPQFVIEKNRKVYGTWQRQLDFTRTIVGYLLGIHNFFRFPFLCYKFGGIFFVPYVLMMILVGIPVVFMEFTIGQYCGVNSYLAFSHLAPILSAVSKLSTWSCVVNCWMYTVIMAWIRIYSNDSTSCVKGWETCDWNHHYNSPHCWTGAADDDCNDPSITPRALHQEMLFYNFECHPVEFYCRTHNWTQVSGRKLCVDSEGQEHTIYERRYHAYEEFFYGAACGLQRKMKLTRKAHLINVTQKLSNSSLADIRSHLLETENYQKWNESSDDEIIREYLYILQQRKDDKYQKITDEVFQYQFQQDYWTDEARDLVEDTDSSASGQLQEVSVTTWIMTAVFLFEDLLKLTLLSYVLNAVPFMVLIYVTMIAISFKFSGNGIDNLFTFSFTDLANIDMWSEAVIQVIYTTGVGNGVLISLATFNNFNHSYLTDLFCTLGLSLSTSCCGVLICFCSLGHYLKLHDIDVPFREYIRVETVSSVEFAFIVYSHFLTLITDRNVVTIAFFFMVTSFATDTTIRLVQNVLDTLVVISARLKYHSTMTLVAVCFMGYLMLVPALKNGGIALFVDFEYFTMRYVIPTIVAFEIAGTLFIYKGSRVVDNAEQMGVFSSYKFRFYITISMYIAFGMVLATVVANVWKHKSIRFNGVKSEQFTETFGWVFFASPLIMAFLSVVKQLIVVPRSRWWWLFIPLMGKDRKLRRAFLRRIQGGRQGQAQGKTDRGEGHQTDHEATRAAALQWRILESRLLLALMAKRKEDQEKKVKELNEPTEEQDAQKEEARKSAPNSWDEPVVHVAATTKPDEQEDQKKVEYETVDSGEATHYTSSKRHAFIHPRANTFWSRMKAAFMGRAMQKDSFCPMRHAGRQRLRRIVTKISADGKHSTSITEEGDNDDERQSQDSVSNDEDDVEKTRVKYLNFMDYMERWPGRLDESEIESEGSSVTDTDSDEEKNL